MWASLGLLCLYGVGLRSERPFGECVFVDEMVPEVGIEPTLSFLNQILSLARLPVSPLRLG